MFPNLVISGVGGVGGRREKLTEESEHTKAEIVYQSMPSRPDSGIPPMGGKKNTAVYYSFCVLTALAVSFPPNLPPPPPNSLSSPPLMWLYVLLLSSSYYCLVN